MANFFKKIAMLVVALAVICLIASIGKLLPITTTTAAITAGISVLIIGIFFFYGKRR